MEKRHCKQYCHLLSNKLYVNCLLDINRWREGRGIIFNYSFHILFTIFDCLLIRFIFPVTNPRYLRRGYVTSLIISPTISTATSVAPSLKKTNFSSRSSYAQTLYRKLSNLISFAFDIQRTSEESPDIKVSIVRLFGLHLT